jgi:hypothetical protein
MFLYILFRLAKKYQENKKITKKDFVDIYSSVTSIGKKTINRIYTKK